MSIYGNPVMLGGSGGGGGGGSTVDRTLQNSLLNNAVYTKEGYIGGFNNASSYWQPYNASRNALDVDWRQPWALHLKFKFTELETSRRECLFGCVYGGQYFGGTITAEVLKEDNWWFGFSTNGSSWDSQTTISTSDVPYVVNTDYTIHIEYNGTTITITVSDGTHIGIQTVTPSATLYYNTNYKLGFGNIAQSGSLYARYTYFDPNDCYIESNGTKVWGSRSSGSRDLSGTMPPTSDIGSDGDIYTQVYADSTLTGDGASYIDTGIYPTSRHSFQVYFALTQIDETNYPCIVAVRNGSSGLWMMRFNPTASTSNSRSVSIAKQDSPTGSQQWYDSTTLKQDDFVGAYHLLSMGFDLSSMNLYYAEDGSIKHTYGTSGNSNSWPYTWWMFACNNANSLQSGSVAKMILKHCKIWDQNENLIAYFVPYLDGNTPCALNLVTGTKHYNLGTGDFTYTATGTVKVGLVWLKENGAWSIIGHS